MQLDISKLNTVQIEPYNITIRDSTIKGVFTAMVETKCDAVKYDIVDHVQLSNLPAVGFEDGFYCFTYKIKTKDDIITNIKVEPSQKIKLEFNYNCIEIDQDFKVYRFLLTEPEIRICVFYNENETSEQFKISYTGYVLNHRLKQKLKGEYRSPVPYLDFSQIGGAPLVQVGGPITDYSSIYYTIDKLKNPDSELPQSG